MFRSTRVSPKSHVPSRPPVPRPIYSLQQDPMSRIIRKLDNPSIVEPSPVGVYITTNEYNKADIAQKLTTRSPVFDGCHIGFSGWHNFDIMALRQSSRGIIVDLNPESTLFLHASLETLRKSTKREDFIARMIAYVRNHTVERLKEQKKDLTCSITFSPNIRFDYDTPEEEIIAHAHEKLGWLADESRFEHIKRLAEADKIALITEDIRATKTFE